MTLAFASKPKHAPSELLTTRKVALFALGRLKPGEMNRAEHAYAQHLELRKQAGEVLWWKFEAIKLRLADNCFLTPDFAVLLADGRFQFHDTKGARHSAVYRDDAKAKIKCAGEQFPFEFFVCFPRLKKDGGGWDVEAI